MLINYQCPKCGRAGEALGHLAGKSIRCPGCSESIQLPGGEGLVSGMPPRRPTSPSADESPEEAAARESLEYQHGVLAEMQRQGRQLEKISNNIGCIFIILAIWFFCGVLSWFISAAITLGRVWR